MVGIHLSTLCTQSWGDPLIPHIKKAYEIGYDGVEFPIMEPTNVPIKDYQNILSDFNLTCTCGTGLNSNTDIGSMEISIRDAGIEHLKRCIEVSNQLGSSVLGGVLLSAWGKCSDETKSLEWKKRVVESLDPVLEYAQKHNVRLAGELVNRYEGSFMNSVSDAVEFEQLISHPFLGYHYDSFHAHIEERNHKDSITRLKEKLYHFHICGSDRGIPQNDGINWEQITNGLQSINYTHWLVVEIFSQANTEIGKSTNIWTKPSLSPIEIAKKAYEFARELEKKIRG
ncbi:MAG: sugar phosphate isomerase/epimerase family protein [Brevinema sp.]